MMIRNSEEEVFSSDRHPEMNTELKTLKEAAAQLPVYFKGDIVISFLKKHAIKSEWINANPKMVAFLRNYSAKTSHIESLFEFYRMKPATLDSYEKYIRVFFL